MLFLKRQDHDRILAYCRSELPNEACGLLGGRKEGEDQYVEELYLMTNTEKSPEHYAMDPKEQFAAAKDMRTRGCELLGSFHSHPGSPACPSEEDKRLACDPDMHYLILSLMEAEPVLHAFRIDREKHVTMEELKVVEHYNR